jgi:hypothetical protein
MSASATLLAFPRQPEDRLRLATRRLEQALAEQAVALASFREAMGELKGSVSGLAGSLEDYRSKLDGVQAACATAHATAREAESNAALLVARCH